MVGQEGGMRDGRFREEAWSAEASEGGLWSISSMV